MILQRASAGSGKTFKLAKTYLRLFLSRLDQESGRYMLLTPAQISGSHGRILGVTFTNKATNEMKERIVSKLAALAKPHPAPGRESADWNCPDYLLDFTGETPGATDTDDILYSQATGKPASREEVSRTASRGLQVLLRDYGNFHISTIDTFFQGVLRAFAYELQLRDNYHVELNDDYLARLGIDQVLSSISRDQDPLTGEQADNSYVRTWTRTRIERDLGNGERWNIFGKSEGIPLYKGLLDMAGKMSKESFKEHRRLLADYFSEPTRFDRFSEACLEQQSQTAGFFRTFRSRLREFEDAVSEEYGGARVTEVLSGVGTVWKDMCRMRPGSETSAAKLKTVFGALYCAEPTAQALKGRAIAKQFKDRWNPQGLSALAMERMMKALWEWQQSQAYWNTVMERLDFLGILRYVEAETKKQLKEENIIPLSATNEILARIISDDDTPFIYERIGSRLHHYLLDEFQDTSQQQWQNLRPLLQQSTDQGDECLVIGDGKQSIYRFRNADPSIIGSGVTAAIPQTRIVPSPTDTPLQRAEVGANWRSASEVVETNNRIFSELPRLLELPGEDSLQTLYAEAVQLPKKRVKDPLTGEKVPLAGYVDIDFNKPLGLDFLEQEEQESLMKSKKEDKYYAGLPPLIDSLRARGYGLKDMAILVNRKKEGSKAIAAIMGHNRVMTESDPGYAPIAVMSEESLKVAGSQAVAEIVAQLAMLAEGFTQRPEQEEGAREESVKSNREQREELRQFNTAFQTLRSRHPELSTRELMLMAKKEPTRADASLHACLRASQMATLPDMVEVAAARVMENAPAEQMPYVVAFKDAVMEFCESHPSDLGSFLLWWEENKSNLSIAMPEGLDAVQVMTIHKSKGLEFPIVFIPKADWNLRPRYSALFPDLIWSRHKPNLPGLDAEDFPEVIPVTPRDDMDDEQSPFHAEYLDYKRDHIVDNINKAYVAFTRAVRELHVCAPEASNADDDSPSLPYHLRKALGVQKGEAYRAGMPTEPI